MIKNTNTKKTLHRFNIGGRFYIADDQRRQRLVVRKKTLGPVVL